MEGKEQLYKERIELVRDIETLAQMVLKNHDAGRSYKSVLAGLVESCKELTVIQNKLS